MLTDSSHMKIALKLALKAEGMTSPNPIVGAVVVKNGRIVGKGYHKRCGKEHAEVLALRDAGAKAKDAALYVTLEPCNHFGRTPPCTDAIIRSGVREVIIAMKDPNPVTRGRGIKKLKKRGISVRVGVLEDEARAINKPFIKYITKKVPFVRLKMAESIDGKIATKTGDSRWVTGQESRNYVQKLRAKVDAVMVGINTAKKDDPLLLSRIPKVRQPVRVIVDAKMAAPASLEIFSTLKDGPVIIATTGMASFGKAELLSRRGISVLFCKSSKGRVDLRDLLKKLGMLGISDVMVEGGGELAASLVEEGLVDQFIFMIAPKIVGGRDAKTAIEGVGVVRMSEALRLDKVSVSMMGEDILVLAEAR